MRGRVAEIVHRGDVCASFNEPLDHVLGARRARQVHGGATAFCRVVRIPLVAAGRGDTRLDVQRGALPEPTLQLAEIASARGAQEPAGRAPGPVLLRGGGRGRGGHRPRGRDAERPRTPRAPTRLPRRDRRRARHEHIIDSRKKRVFRRHPRKEEVPTSTTEITGAPMASARGAFARLARATPERLVRRAPSRALASAADDGAHADALRRAGATPPAHLRELLDVLLATGGSRLDPSDRTGVHPLVLPLARVSSESLGGLPGSADRKDETRASDEHDEHDEHDAHATIGLLVRPADVRGGETNSDQLRVVASGPGGIELLAPSAAHHVHRALVEEDFRLFRDGTRDGKDDANVRLALAAAGALGEAPHAICPPGRSRRLTRRRPNKGRRFSCTPLSAGASSPPPPRRSSRTTRKPAATRSARW